MLLLLCSFSPLVSPTPYNFNRQMGAIWEIFDLLGVQINMSGGFEVSETFATVRPAVSSVPRNFIPGWDGTGFFGSGFVSYFYLGIFLF